MWQCDDTSHLIKACHRLVSSHASGFVRRSRRGSDELHPRKEAEHREAGLHEAKVVADFDELYQVGCEVVLEVRDRYDPTKGSFQSFAYLCVRGAMIDTLTKKRQHLEVECHTQDESIGTLLRAALRETLEGESDDSAFLDRLHVLLQRTSLEEWRDIVERADF